MGQKLQVGWGFTHEAVVPKHRMNRFPCVLGFRPRVVLHCGELQNPFVAPLSQARYKPSQVFPVGIGTAPCTRNVPHRTPGTDRGGGAARQGTQQVEP